MTSAQPTTDKAPNIPRTLHTDHSPTPPHLPFPSKSMNPNNMNATQQPGGGSGFSSFASPPRFLFSTPPPGSSSSPPASSYAFGQPSLPQPQGPQHRPSGSSGPFGFFGGGGGGGGLFGPPAPAPHYNQSPFGGFRSSSSNYSAPPPMTTTTHAAPRPAFVPTAAPVASFPAQFTYTSNPATTSSSSTTLTIPSDNVWLNRVLTLLQQPRFHGPQVAASDFLELLAYLMRAQQEEAEKQAALVAAMVRGQREVVELLRRQTEALNALDADVNDFVGMAAAVETDRAQMCDLLRQLVAGQQGLRQRQAEMLVYLQDGAGSASASGGGGLPYY